MEKHTYIVRYYGTEEGKKYRKSIIFYSRYVAVKEFFALSYKMKLGMPIERLQFIEDGEDKTMHLLNVDKNVKKKGDKKDGKRRI